MRTWRTAALPLDEDARKELEGAILGDVNVNAQQQQQVEEKESCCLVRTRTKRPDQKTIRNKPKSLCLVKRRKKSRAGQAQTTKSGKSYRVRSNHVVVKRPNSPPAARYERYCVCSRGEQRSTGSNSSSLRGGEMFAGEVHPKLEAIYARNAQSCWVNFESQPTTPNAKDVAKKDLFGGNVENDDDDFGGGGMGGFDDDYDNNNNDNMDTPRKGFSLDGDEDYDKADEGGDKAMDWSHGSKKMLNHLSTQFDKTNLNELSLDEQVRGKTRADAAKMFYQVLVLRTHGYLDVEQEEPYGDVKMKPGLVLEERMKQQL